MGKELHRAECDFLIRSEDEDEVIEVTQRHAERTHDMAMSRGDVERLWKTY